MITPAPTLATAPTVEEVAAVTSPIERARLLTRIARECGTLPGPLADLRRLALIAALAEGHRVVAVAAQVGLSRARVAAITGPAPDKTGGA